MEIQVGRLRNILDLLAPAVAGRKATLPVTKSVLFQGGRARATNLEVAVSVAVPEFRDAAFLLEHKPVSETFKYILGTQTLQVDHTDGMVRFLTPGHSVAFPSKLNAEEFPPLPSVDMTEFPVDGDAFLAALSKVQIYCATDEARPVLTGVAIELGDRVMVVASDGFRLVWEPTQLRLPPSDGQAQLILPSKTIDILRALWKRSEKQPDVKVNMGEFTSKPSLTLARLAVAKRNMMVSYNVQQVQFRWGPVTVVAQLVQGSFPAYKSLIPGPGTSRVVVDAASFTQALRQLRHVAAASSNIVRLEWAGQTMTVSATSEDEGDVAVTLPVSTGGTGNHIAFDWGILNAYFASKEGPVMLEMTSPDKPALCTYRGIAHVVIMPMFVKWTGDPLAPEDPETPDEEPPPTEQLGEDGAGLTEAEPNEATSQEEPNSEEVPAETRPRSRGRKASR